MKRFIKQILAFLIPLLAITLLLEVLLRKIPNDYAYKKAQIELQNDSIRTLLLGSSHTMYGLNPEYFSESTFNLGHVSQTIDLDYYLLKKYLKTLPQLKTVVLRLSYTTLHEQLCDGPESWRLKDYNLYYNLNISNKLKHKSEVLSVKLKNNLTRLQDYYLNDEDMITVDPSGWATFDKEQVEKPINEMGLIAAKRHMAKDNTLVDENSQFLENLIQLCKAEDVNVVLVTMPAHQSYRENLSESQLELVLQAGKKMGTNYDNCQYLNLLDAQNFTDADFYDGDHLNRRGAKKLSRFIDRLISKSVN